MLRSNDPRSGTHTSTALNEGYRTNSSGELIRPDGSRVTDLSGRRMVNDRGFLRMSGKKSS